MFNKFVYNLKLNKCEVIEQEVYELDTFGSWHIYTAFFLPG